MLLAQVLGHAATDLREGAAHDAAEVALESPNMLVSGGKGKREGGCGIPDTRY